MKTSAYLAKATLFLLALCWSSLSFAVNVDVDPGDYDGTWRIQGLTGVMSGPASLNINPGQWNLIIGYSAAPFTVDTAGLVTSHNTGAATGGANSLTFNTVVIHVDTAGFQVQNYGIPEPRWIVQGLSTWMTEAADVTLVKGIQYRVAAGTWGSFALTLDQNGNVSVDNGVSAVGNGTTLTFNSIPITVDPANFLNQVHATNLASWRMAGVVKAVSTVAVVNVVPGVRYGVLAGNLGLFFIQVDGSGNVTVENGVSAVGGQQNLVFETTTISIDPGEFINQVDGGLTAFWSVGDIIDNAQTSGDVIVVPATRVAVRAGLFSQFAIQVDEFGDITVENGISATSYLNNLTLNTETIQVDPGAYTGTWGISRALDLVSGQQTVKLVPGTRYRLTNSAGIGFFNITSPCALNPSSFTFSVGTFNLSCGLADGDGDGVPDASDNCPADINTDQLDQDLDGAGDACDVDLDGDGVDNANDNCPAFANAGQGDLDGDGLGDVCDSDVDGDSVADANDNCPLTANTGQGDSDFDGMGDACDIDDDNDAVADDSDNCPLNYNPGQSDQDGNGQGDVCDSDIDGDGVLNNEDDCAATPADQAITPMGCSGSQYVALQCVRDNFVQHGQYVSCVAHTAKYLIDIRVITIKEKSVFVKEAAKK